LTSREVADWELARLPLTKPGPAGQKRS